MRTLRCIFVLSYSLKLILSLSFCQKAFKGAWLSPELLELVAGHIKRCGKAFGAFGKPLGALGLAAAAVRLTLELHLSN